MESFKIAVLAFLVLFSACKRMESPAGDSDKKLEVTTTEHSKTHRTDTAHKNEYMVLATLFHQEASEYRALCYQAYNVGKMMLDKDLADKSIDKHRIVVLDIDETVLDNSPYEAQCIIENINYPQRWDEWCNKASAGAVPGALDFLNYARANGVSVFYVTNRKQHLKDVTIKNLIELGFPQVDDEHVMMRTDADSKEPRRMILSDRFHISLLFGDNLNDFSDVFENSSNEIRSLQVDKYKTEFGKRFILLPNSMYGEWETNLYKANVKLNDSIKSASRHKALRGF